MVHRPEGEYEYRVIERMHACIAPEMRITLLADRGFGDQKLYRLLAALGWDYVIRFRGRSRSSVVGASRSRNFLDTKNLRFGLGLSATHIGTPARRDRLLLIAAIAQALLTLLGGAGEACGLDRTLKTNTSAKRQMSLFNQGVYWYEAIPTCGSTGCSDSWRPTTSRSRATRCSARSAHVRDRRESDREHYEPRRPHRSRATRSTELPDRQEDPGQGTSHAQDRERRLPR